MTEYNVTDKMNLLGKGKAVIAKRLKKLQSREGKPAAEELIQPTPDSGR